LDFFLKPAILIYKTHR